MHERFFVEGFVNDMNPFEVFLEDKKTFISIATELVKIGPNKSISDFFHFHINFKRMFV
jgi:hypothetical protein